ncbi:MAG: L,D-transpeptidase Cds6 family protein [Burkholderiales bacterium]
MTLPRIAALVLTACLGLATSVWGQSDPLQDANQLFRQGQFDRAMERVNSYLSSRPKDARGRFLKGLILTEQNKPNDAIKVFTDLSQDFPELPEPYNNLAVLYASQGQYDKARNSLEMAIRTHPSYAVAHENLGDIYATLASQAYDKALQLDSNNATARKKLALIKELVPAKPATTLAKAEPDKAAPAKPATEAAPITPIAPATPPKAASEASKPPPPKTPASDKPASAADPTAAVLKMLEAWTHAWSSNDAEGYLSFYAPDFETPNHEPRSAWEENRRERLAKPKKIHVTASSPRVKFTDNNHATVTFRQSYSSDNIKASGNKTLHLVRHAERWLIQRESIDK